VSNDFNNRMDAQRTFLKVINSCDWAAEPLCGLSQGAILRWTSINSGQVPKRIADLVNDAGEVLYFLANKSQEQISPEYGDASKKFDAILTNARVEVEAIKKRS
jgi:hypothetical protein